MPSKTKKPASVKSTRSRFNRALAVKQVGGEYLKSKSGKKYVKVGGGLFPERQVVSARKRYGRVKYGLSRKQLKKTGI